LWFPHGSILLPPFLLDLFTSSQQFATVAVPNIPAESGSSEKNDENQLNTSMSSGFSQRFCSSSAAPRYQGLVTIEGCLSSGGCGIFMKATKPHVLRILKVKHGKTLKSELNLKALGLAK
jgi:hypothetical protein